MNEEELKAGERYNFTLLYTGQSINNKFRFESPTGIHYILGLGDMEAVSPVSATKYAPCRLFKKGDIVEPVERWGRKLRLNAGHYRIDKDEVDNRVMMTHCETGFSCAAIDTVYLKLVTPVEELEPYSIADHIHGWIVYKDTPGNVVANFNKTHPHAKAAAEAECARLNAAHGKELKNTPNWENSKHLNALASLLLLQLIREEKQ